MNKAADIHGCETAANGKPKRGRRPLPADAKQTDANIYALPGDIAFLLTWNEASPSLAFAELIAMLRKFRPGGRFSAVPYSPESRNRPGTKTQLKKRIAALEKQLRAAGMEPVTE